MADDENFMQRFGYAFSYGTRFLLKKFLF